MKDTRNEIIRLANELIRSVGFHSFSYGDISKSLNIKNAAIHYYFPSKTDLGIEIIKQNTALFQEKSEQWKNLNYRQQYENYITMHDSFIDRGYMCIVGSLSTSFDTLPESMQNELQNLVHTIINWLTWLLDEGKENKEFTFEESAEKRAYLIHSALLSSLLMNKVLRNDVYKSIQEYLLVI